MKIGKLLKEIKGVFKPPVKRYYFGKLAVGSPYFYPRPKICIKNVHLGWKDKFDSPRMEWVPQFHIRMFNLQFVIWWNAPDGNDDKYYEQILWWLEYAKKDIDVARDTWDWIDYKTKESSWNDNYLEPKYRKYEKL